jgi:membrane protein YdbS with pleckstrin-like domain
LKEGVARDSLALLLSSSAAELGRQAAPRASNLGNGTGVRSQTATALYVVLMAAVIVAVDLLFFKNRFWERLTANVGIVVVFAVVYFRFLKRP